MIAMTFDYSLDFNRIDFRKHPELYRVGKGEQGVLLVEPYKSEILPHWRFKTPNMARVSANKIYKMFLQYKAQENFVGMDMARKFLQMGYSRARRYANHKTGRKYAKLTRELLPREARQIEGRISKALLREVAAGEKRSKILGAKEETSHKV